eukprot:TRINITY_DN1707_c0_g1_i2.p1 TRINITY_DN1707_c0_g1~~TRINITY_DN1707_c0_g1_i2.p1  ORF type:complete len:272 (-),score=65.31 TRINITY_DN1707_c0_g1_i2:322-1047(-)
MVNAEQQAVLGVSLLAAGGLTVFWTVRRSLRTKAPALTFDDIAARRAVAKPKKSILYTKTGDKGASSLYSGERRSKTDATFQALGASDELNSVIGVAREYCVLAGNGLDELLAEIQSRLFDVGACIATPRDKASEAKLAKTAFPPKCTAEVEFAIDELDSKLPPLKTFILPSGGLAAVHLHLARVVCRRAERSAIPLVEAGEVDPEVGRYLNRLSDFLFAAARYASHVEGAPETSWVKFRE